MRTSSPRNWLPIAVLVGGGLLCGVVAVVALGPTLMSAAFGLEPVPTVAPTLAPLTATLTPIPLTPTLPPVTGGVSGRVWRDVCPPGGESTEACVLDATGRFRGNGQREADEPGFGGVTVKIGAGQCPASGQAVAVTGPDGSFRFEDLSPGLYCLSVEVESNPALGTGVWTYPTAVDAQSRAGQTVNVAAGVLAEDINFGWDDSAPPTPPTPTATTTGTITRTPTVTATFTRTVRPTSTRTRTSTPGPTASRTRTATPTYTITRTPTRSMTPTITRTPTVTSTRTATTTLTVTPTGSATATGTATVTTTPTTTSTATPTSTLPPAFGVVIHPTSAAGAGDPAQVVTYTLAVTNTGTSIDSFAVTLGTTFTAVADPDPILNLGGGLSTALTVSVTVPADALAGVVGTTVVTVTSQGDSNLFAVATLDTTVNQTIGVQAAPDTTAITATAGSVVTYTILVTNTGNATDSYTITVNTAGTFVTTISLTSVTGLAPGASVPIVVQVDIPNGALPGGTHVVTLTFTSLTDASASDIVSLTTTVAVVPNNWRRALLGPPPRARLRAH